MSFDITVNNLKVMKPILSSLVSSDGDSMTLHLKPTAKIFDTTTTINKQEGGKCKRRMKKSAKPKKSMKRRGGADESTEETDLKLTSEMTPSTIESSSESPLMLDSSSESETESISETEQFKNDILNDDKTNSIEEETDEETEKEEKEDIEEEKKQVQTMASKLSESLNSLSKSLMKGGDDDYDTATIDLINNIKEEQKKLCGGCDCKKIKGGDSEFGDYFNDGIDRREYETDEDLDSSDDEQMGGAEDFNTFINNLFAKKGGKKREYSEEAKKYNDKTTAIIKSVYPDITHEELKAVRSEIYQKIRAKYEPEKFKKMKDFEKSKLLFEATTPEVVKKIDLKKAVENRKKRIAELFGKKDFSEAVTPDVIDEKKKAKKETKKATKKETKKDTKKETKKKATKKTKRGGKLEKEEVELPFMLDGGCDCKV